MMKILFLTNIPTPYRHYYYEKLDQIADIHVAYLAKNEKGRSWDYRENSNPSYSSFAKSYQIVVRGKSYYAVRRFADVVEQSGADILILAGSWNYLSTMQILSSRRVRNRVTTGFWSEGNLIDETVSKNKWVKKLKKSIYGSFDFFLSPGERADELIRSYTVDKPIVRLTNVAQPIYAEGKVRNKSEPLRICLIARLMPRKNVVGYISAVLPLLKNNLIAVDILGEGEQKEQLRELVENERVESSVNLCGQIPTPEVPDYIMKADVLCLPSLRDPYPLTAIEALFLAKPLLISNTIGSYPEVLEKNGLSFDPLSPAEMLEKTLMFVRLEPDEIAVYSNNSRGLADKHFDPDRVINKFVEDLKRLEKV